MVLEIGFWQNAIAEKEKGMHHQDQTQYQISNNCVYENILEIPLYHLFSK